MFVWVFSHSFALTDAQGNQLSVTGAKIPIQVPTGTQANPVVIQIAGRI